MGVCGKTPEVSALQDLLLYRLKGLAGVAVHARSVAGISDPDADEFFNLAIFSTLTNVNFDDDRFVKYIKQANRYIAGLKQKLEAAGAAPVPVPQVLDDNHHELPWAFSLTNQITQVLVPWHFRAVMAECSQSSQTVF